MCVKGLHLALKNVIFRSHTVRTNLNNKKKLIEKQRLWIRDKMTNDLISNKERGFLMMIFYIFKWWL